MRKVFSFNKIWNKLKIFFIPVFIIPVSLLLTSSFQKKYELKGRVEKSIEVMYNDDDLSACSLFAGHFINFGFWENKINSRKISLHERIESQKNLYRVVLNNLNIKSTDEVLEVGCGLGMGTTLAYSEYKPTKIVGIDISKAQIARAEKINEKYLKKNKQICFRRSNAENLSIINTTFDVIYTIEAAQHFDSMENFINESYKVLNPKGRLAIASFFGKSKNASKQLSPMIQTVREGIDHINYIDDIKFKLKKAGFSNIQIISIGKNVWPGFDKWVSQTELKNSWTRNWKIGWKNNLIDYYLILADKEDFIYSTNLNNN